MARVHATAAETIKRRLAERAEIHRAEHEAKVMLTKDKEFQLQRLKAQVELKKAELSAGKRRAVITVNPQRNQVQTVTPKIVRSTRRQAPSVLGSFRFASQPSVNVDYWGKGVKLVKPSLVLNLGGQTARVPTRHPVVVSPKKRKAYW